MLKKEKQTHRKTVFEGVVFDIHVDTVLTPNAHTSRREVVEHRGGVSILPVDGNHLYLIKQYRYAIDADLIEAPAGRLELGETPLVAAKRELEEETGLIADDVISIGYMHPTPGYSTERIYLYIAHKLSLGNTNFDQDEHIETFKVSFEDALNMIESGQITDSKTIILIYRAHHMKGLYR